MTGSELMDLAVMERKKYNYLSEFMDISQQMGGVLDRNDRVSARMLLAMREEPLLHLREVNETAKARRDAMEPEDQERVRSLLNGAKPRSREESMFVEQAGRVRSLLERVVQLDKKLSLRMGGDRSFYQK